MFAQACEIARYYTAPVIVSTKTIDNKVDCSCGAFVFLNNEGWIITVAHLFESFIKWKADESEIVKYFQSIKEIEQNLSLNQKIKNKKIAKIQKNRNWISNHSFWWGVNEIQLDECKIFGELDLAIGKLKKFNPESIKHYPKIKNPKDLKIGTSLCKLGYPFHNISATFDQQNNRFVLAENVLPLPMFPIDGIFTRNVIGGKTKDGKFDIKFLETSSPGLRGQSGGPIFDVNSNIYAIQSRTINLPLGFSPRIQRNGKEIEENQFINVGLGVHPETIIQVLTDNGIKFEMAD
jgi:hypothetical protein